MAKKKKVKSKFNAVVAVKTVEMLHEAYVETRTGYREGLRSILQTTQELISRLLNNGKVQHRFLKKLASVRGRRAPTGKVNLPMEVMSAVTGDSRSGRKRASKYGVLLNILRDKDVPSEETAEYIKTHGGIEKILRDNKPALEARAVTHSAKHIEVRSPVETRRLRNDREVRCTIFMRMSDRDRILELPAGA